MRRHYLLIVTNCVILYLAACDAPVDGPSMDASRDLVTAADVGHADVENVRDVRALDLAGDTSSDIAATDAGSDTNVSPGPYPDPGDWPPLAGPGGPRRSFDAAELDTPCAYLTGTERDIDHHNLVQMFDGHLVMPWSPDTGKGGLTFFEFDDPCEPVVVGHGYSSEMRETHSLGISQIGGAWMVTAQIKSFVEGGVQFWDVSDPTKPEVVSKLEYDGFFFPDSYRRVSFSAFWQAPYVYVGAAQVGIVVIDATDPLAPRHVTTWEPEPVAQIGQVQVIGDLLVASTAEGSRAFVLDVSRPDEPRPIPGGDFTIRDSEGTPREIYFGNTSGGYAYFARKDSGGGVIVYDIHDPTSPSFVGDVQSPHSGGYVFVKDDLAFVGEGSRAAIYDLTDRTAPTFVKELHLVGDLDTITPIGNVAVLSVDDDPEPDRGSSVVPWQSAADTSPPRVTWSVPQPGATELLPTSRVGVTFNEFIEPKSAWEGSVRLYRSDLPPDEGRVPGWVSAQETIVNFWPSRPLEPGTKYTFEIPAGGIIDYSGNAIAEPFIMEFETR